MPQDRRPDRKRWSQPLADLIEPCIAPAFAQFGFDEAGLLLFWPDIVGERLAARCEPLRLQWPPRRHLQATQDAATLIVRVDGAFAIELQHQTATVIERINAHVGWRCVSRIALRQAPARARAPRRLPVPAPDAASLAAARVAADGVVDEALREALSRLGARVLAARRSLP